MLQDGRSQVWVPMKSLNFFHFTYSYQPNRPLGRGIRP
jgi:hypothetical protein